MHAGAAGHVRSSVQRVADVRTERRIRGAIAQQRAHEAAERAQAERRRRAERASRTDVLAHASVYFPERVAFPDAGQARVGQFLGIPTLAVATSGAQCPFDVDRAI